MEKYDILITYEIRNREIENLCLIKRELERRGYSVGLKMQYSTYFDIPEPIEASLIVIPAYYRPRAQFYTASHLAKTTRIFNLQWEQVFENIQENNSNTLSSIKAWGRDAVHLAWGERMHQRLTMDWGVPEDHAKLTGHVALDFLRGRLRGYFDDRDTLFERYNIPRDKKVHLFISSLSLTTMHSLVVKKSAPDGDVDRVNRLVKVSIETQKEIVSWFERALNECPNDIVIYRPHPEETSSELLKELQARQPRFRVIGAESVKQWILVCDKIYTWISTSVAEVYASGKGCTVLRPVEIPYENDMRLFEGSEQIYDYDSFIRSFVADSQEFGLSEDMIKKYYYIDSEKYTYELICDAIEQAYNEDRYLLKKPLDNPFGGFINAERIKNRIKKVIADSTIMSSIYEKGYLKNTHFYELLADVFYVKNKLEKNYVSDEEIEQIIKKIDSIL